MLFLIEYSPRDERLLLMRPFEEAQRCEAEESRLALELDLKKRALDHEVVLLEAASEDALRITHGRYFESLRQLLNRARGPSMS